MYKSTIEKAQKEKASRDAKVGDKRSSRALTQFEPFELATTKRAKLFGDCE